MPLVRQKERKMENMILIPAVIKETSAGYERCSIQDMLFQNREIECVGPITSGLVQALILQLRYLQKEDKYKEITMYVNSCGGSVTEGLALYDAMQAITCPIRTVCIGQAASMGAAIFASGGIREILTKLTAASFIDFVSDNRD